MNAVGRCFRLLSAAVGVAVLLCAGHTDAAEPLCALPPAAVDRLLAGLQDDVPGFEDRVAAVAERYIGCSPYVADPLPDEIRDWFPYRRTNCTMLVLYVAALANSRSLAAARVHMRHMHYRGGTVAFARRYHFTADRITDQDNAYFAECTRHVVGDPQRLRRVACVLNQRIDGTPTFGGRLRGWRRRVSLHYLPREGFLPQDVAALPSVIGVAFLKRTNWPAGILVGHEGLLVHGDLVHSSPGRGVWRQEDYFTQHFASSVWEGACFFRLLPVR